MSLLHPDREIHLEAADNLGGQWDVQRAEQVLSNLIQNAIKHGTGKISITLRSAEDNVSIAVRNDDRISPDLLPKIFEPFQRGEGKADGLGLGLYIVREIRRAHGGAVTVESSLERGTTFTSVWPRQPRHVTGLSEARHN